MKRRFPIIVLALLVFYTFSTSEISAQFIIPGGEKSGPYLDQIKYKVIVGDDQQVLALLDDEIDLVGEFIDPAHIETLESAEYTRVASTPRNGYGYFCINCAKYPFNITAFRRACAFAFDKNYVSDEIWQGYSDPQDSLLPSVNPYSIEGMLEYSYYDANYDIASHLLENAGFLDVNEDGFLESPDGTNLTIVLESAFSSNIAIETCFQFATDLTAIGLNIEVEPPCFCGDILEKLYFHGDYDIVFSSNSFTSYDLMWMGYEYSSSYKDEPYYNLPNWENANYDNWTSQLLHSTSYEDILEAAYEMQRIWIYDSPAIVAYENIIFSAYRDGRFDGFVNDYSKGIPCWWTNYKVHLKPGYEPAPWGGTLRWSLPLDMDTFNFMSTNSMYTKNVLEMLYDSLMRTDAEGNDILWLAESFTAETHSDNPSVPEGYTQFRFDILKNATWSDGQQLTAEDVAFSLNYYRDSPENPYGVSLTEMVAAYAQTEYTLVVEFDTESYWHLHSFVYKPIIPKHVFLDIGLENWSTWDPRPPTEGMVTSGPFNISNYVAGEYCLIRYNQDYFYGLEHTEWYSYPPSWWLTTSEISTTGNTETATETKMTSTTPTSSEGTTTSTLNPWSGAASFVGFSVTMGSAVVIVVFSYLILRSRVSNVYGSN